MSLLTKPITLIILALVFLLLILYINSTYSFIGRGDYANYSNVARNLVQGRGFTVDYLAFHFIDYQKITHPEDMWPLLQPVWIAISFFFFGIFPFAARIPNAIFLTLLVVITYKVGAKLFNNKVGVVAALLTGFNINLILYSTNWITSDTALAVFSLLIFYHGFQGILEAQKGQLKISRLFWLGIFSGLAILQKPMGVLLPAVYFLYFLYFYRKDLTTFTKPGLVFIISTLLISGPFFIRNLILFKSLFLPTEHYLGYLIKYFPYEKVFGIWYGHPPDLKLWLDYGLVNFLKINFSYFRYSVDMFVYKDLLMPYTVIVLSFVGLIFVRDKRKHFFYPQIILFFLMSLLMATYWHYESRYYAMLIPSFNLLATVALFELFPKMKIKSGLIIAAIAFITFLPSVKSLGEGVKAKTDDPILGTFNWIKNNTPGESVVMTLAPWEMNFHTLRKTIMIPNENISTILWMAKKYASNYLEIEFLGEIKRDDLKDLYQGKESEEFSLLFTNPGSSYVYKINWDKISLDPKTKPAWY